MEGGLVPTTTLNQRYIVPSWIDFKELRSKLKFEEVLAHYGVEVRRKGEQHLGFCPLPGHSGSRRSPSFSANLERGIFHCFGCHAKGNILDFAALMEGEKLEGRGLKKVALKLREVFKIEQGDKSPRESGKKQPSAPVEEQRELPALVNQPLDFELKGLDRSHPYLLDRGFTQETIAYFGLGYCERGSLAGRVAIPLHDTEGRLVGYAGRVVDDAAITADNPRYRMPSKRERDGSAFEFKKGLFLYNGHRVRSPSDNLIAVEGFPSVWWLRQNGFPRAVATMGAECSEEQEDLLVSLVSPAGTLWVMPDGDKAGEKFAQAVIPRLARRRAVRWVKLGEDKQPTDLSARQLKECLTF